MKAGWLSFFLLASLLAQVSALDFVNQTNYNEKALLNLVNIFKIADSSYVEVLNLTFGITFPAGDVSELSRAPELLVESPPQQIALSSYAKTKASVCNSTCYPPFYLGDCKGANVSVYLAALGYTYGDPLKVGERSLNNPFQNNTLLEWISFRMTKSFSGNTYNNITASQFYYPSFLSSTRVSFGVSACADGAIMGHYYYTSGSTYPNPPYDGDVRLSGSHYWLSNGTVIFAAAYHNTVASAINPVVHIGTTTVPMTRIWGTLSRGIFVASVTSITSTTGCIAYRFYFPSQNDAYFPTNTSQCLSTHSVGCNQTMQLCDSSGIYPTTSELTTQPLTTQPLTTQPLTTNGLTTIDITTKPLTTQPLTTKPLTTKPLTTQPLTTNELTTKPLTTKELTTAPFVTTASLTTQPLTTRPLTTQPLTTSPLTTQPTPSGLTATGNQTATSSDDGTSTPVSTMGNADSTSSTTETDTTNSTGQVESPSSSGAANDMRNVWIGIGAGGGFLVLCSVLIAALLIRRKKKKPDNWRRANSEAGVEMIDRTSISLTRSPSSLALGADERIPEITDVEISERIGGGKFGNVYRGVWNGVEVALKQLKDQQQKFTDLYELRLLPTLRHPNIVQFFGVFIAYDKSEYMVMEYVRQGSLQHVLQRDRRILSPADLLQMSISIAAGMAYLEQLKIIHRDLSCRNCLVKTEDGKYIVKIADFGLSVENTTEGTAVEDKDSQIPVKWSAPEVIKNGQYSGASDCWAFGVTLWEVFEYGATPYPGMSNTEAIRRVNQGYRLPKPTNCPLKLFELMTSCWAINPKDRPQFKKLHASIQSVIWEEKSAESSQNDPRMSLKHSSERASSRYDSAPLDNSSFYGAPDGEVIKNADQSNKDDGASLYLPAKSAEIDFYHQSEKEGKGKEEDEGFYK